MSLEAALGALHDETGRSLRALSDQRPLLVCLLRHSGCTFCRETLAELAKQRAAIERAGLGIAVLGMSASASTLAELGARFGLSGVSWVADPERLLYRALRIPRGKFLQLFGLSVLLAGLRGALRGYGLGRPDADPFQMPGTAVIHRGRVLRQFIHQSAADRPDYEGFACGLSQS